MRRVSTHRIAAKLLAPLTCALVATLAVAAPAFAAAPEPPTLTVEHPVPATSAFFDGVLNPKATEPSGTGEYHFLYKASTTKECEGGGETAPLSAVGFADEALGGEQVTGLTANTEYAVCLVFKTLEGEATSAPVTFTTALPPEAPETKSPATSITATTALLEGALNPKAAGNPGTYEFLYRASSSECTEGSVTPAGTAAGAEAEAAATEATGLAPATQYTFCLLARNEAGETTLGNPVTFTTLPAGPTVESESASSIKATEATLEATVNPNNQKTTVAFEYASEEAKLGTPEATVLPAGELPAGPTGQPVSAATGAALTQNTTYFYRAVAENQQSKKEGKAIDGPTQSFKTALPPEAPETGKAEPVTATTATLHGILSPHAEGNPGTYEFLYRASATECEGEGQKQTEAGSMSGEKAQAVEAEATGLLPNATYSFCLLARTEAGEIAIGNTQTFTTASAKPTIHAEAATNISETAADLTALINPNGTETTYHFQYGTSTEYGSVTPDASAGSGRVDFAASQHITALTANITYHWRLIATNAAGTETGVDHTFVDDTTTHSLPDGRQYELVTPTLKNGAILDEAFGGGSAWHPLIAPDGKDLIAPSIQCFGGAESCIAAREREGEPYEFARTPSGWVTHPLAPPVTSFESSTLWAADAETHTALFSAPTPPSGGDDFYLRNAKGELPDIGHVGEGLEGSVPGSGPSFRKLNAIISTSDFSHVLYLGHLLWSLDGEAEKEFSLYEYAGTGNAHPALVGVTGVEGSTSLVSNCETYPGGGGLGGPSTQSYGSLSGDGRTAYFTAVPCSGGTGENAGKPVPVHTLYARIDGEAPAARTVLISGPTPSTCASTACIENTGEPVDARQSVFAGASNDGSRAFFTSTQQFTDNANEGKGEAGVECHEARAGGCNLYESVCPNHCDDPAERRLSDLSEAQGAQPVSGGARVQGVMAISPDGSHVYFIAQGVLTGAEENQNHEKAVEGQNNLYVSEGGQPRFIATLPSSDEGAFSGETEWTQGIGLANVTPDGRFLVFLSHGALTPDDTRVEEGAPAQVYRYDAGTGALARVSIGEHGYNDNGNDGKVGLDEAKFANASKHGYALGIGPGRADPTMSHDGQYVFFESPAALAPGALNYVQNGTFLGKPEYAENIYEYHEGNVSLISDGKDVSPPGGAQDIGVGAVELLGADASGANVFFQTNDQLTSQDTDTQRDYYDARICTSEEPCVAPPAPPAAPCSEEACHGAASGSPAAQTPGSQSFTGPGNLAPAPPVKPKHLTNKQKLARALKACRTKHNHHKRALCEKQARRQFGVPAKTGRAKKSTRAGNDRGAKS